MRGKTPQQRATTKQEVEKQIKVKQQLISEAYGILKDIHSSNPEWSKILTKINLLTVDKATLEDKPKLKPAIYGQNLNFGI